MATPNRQTHSHDTDPHGADRRPAEADFTVGPSGSVAPASQERGGAADPLHGGPSARPGHPERPLSSDDDPVRQSIADAGPGGEKTRPAPSEEDPGGLTTVGRIALVLAAVVVVLLLILMI